MTEIIKVDGMSCEHCEMRVTKAVKAVGGVLSAKASADDGLVTVELESAGALEAVKTAITDAGYDVN